MSRRASKSRPDTPRRTASPPAGAPASPPLPWVAGLACLSVAVAASAILALNHLTGLSMPGCGPESACARAAASYWGKVRLLGLEWPVSYLGFAYFDAALVGWVLSRRGLPKPLLFIAYLGGAISIFYLFVIVIENTACMYCIAAHVANLAFCVAATMTSRGALPGGGLAAVAGLGAFITTSAVLGAVDAVTRSQVRAQGEAERSAAVQEMIRQGRDQPRPEPSATQPADPSPAPQPSASPNETAPAPSPPPAPPLDDSPLAAGQSLAGRYIWGPAEAPIRIVLITGYQCPDCLRVEPQVEQLIQTRKDVQISIRHFPFNKDCNPFVGRTMQPNGCWAARAAEAAGMLYGVDGFWKMHKWLFDPNRRGAFTKSEELEEALRSWGFDPTGFAQVMSSEETLRRIREDCELAADLGLFFSPMIFVNGVELKGWHVPNALIRTVEELAATNPPALPPTADRPVGAVKKYVADWREQTPLAMPPDARAWPLGPEDARVQVIVYGDYQEPSTAEADQLIRKFMTGRSDIRYTFRPFPFDTACNPTVQQARFPKGCRAAAAAEAAGQLGGVETYWKAHVWLMSNAATFSDETVKAAAATFGLDGEALLAAMDSDDVQAAIKDDVESGRKFPSLRLGMPAGISTIPSIFVNGKFLPRWKTDQVQVIDLVLEEACRAPAQ